jgi:ribose/xylose/arabinose/galactoside ABC-type transport system permease subunit
MDAVAVPSPAKPKRRLDAAALVQRYASFGILVALLIGASLMSDSFLSTRNLLNVLRQISGTGIMAMGMLFVILTGGIDLSVGSIAALTSVLTALFLGEHGLPQSLGMALLAGAACGLVSGLLVAWLRLPSFVMTLAMMTIARGLSLIISKGQPIIVEAETGLVSEFGSGFTLGIPNPVIFLLAVYAAGGVVLAFTGFGRLVKAIGSNTEAVRLSGIAVPRYLLAVYIMSGVLAGVAGVISTSRTGVGLATVGVGAELQSIAAVVIGGASLMGGRGGVVNTLIGAIVLGVINNIMNLAGVPGYHQEVFMGLIIIVAVLLQQGTHWMNRR